MRWCQYKPPKPAATTLSVSPLKGSVTIVYHYALTSTNMLCMYYSSNTLVQVIDLLSHTAHRLGSYDPEKVVKVNLRVRIQSVSLELSSSSSSILLASTSGEWIIRSWGGYTYCVCVCTGLTATMRMNPNKLTLRTGWDTVCVRVCSCSNCSVPTTLQSWEAEHCWPGQWPAAVILSCECSLCVLYSLCEVVENKMQLWQLLSLLCTISLVIVQNKQLVWFLQNILCAVLHYCNIDHYYTYMNSNNLILVQ